MSIKKLRNKERRSLKAVMQGGVARGEKRGTRIKSFVKLRQGNSNGILCARTHQGSSSTELLMLHSALDRLFETQPAQSVYREKGGKGIP